MLRAVRRVVENIGPGVLLHNPKRNVAEDVIQAIEDVSYDLAEHGVLDMRGKLFTTLDGVSLSFLNGGLERANRSLANGNYQTAVKHAIEGVLNEANTGRIDWNTYHPYIQDVVNNRTGFEMLQNIQLQNRLRPPRREDEPTAAPATTGTVVPDRDPEAEAEDPSELMAGIPIAGTGYGGICHYCKHRQDRIKMRLMERAKGRQMAKKKHF